MGCWNKTCGLSNLHITHGTPVYVFVLEQDRDSSNCYSTSLFSPLLLPFESEYNDYGGGENSKGITFDLVMNGIKKQLVEMEIGENKYHDIAVNREGFGEEMFFEAVHENRLFIENRYSLDSNTPVTFTMIRKDIVYNILENRVIEKYVGDGKGYCGWNNNYIRYQFKDVLADLRPLLDAYLVKLAEADEALKSYMLFSGFETFAHEMGDNLAANWLRFDGHRFSRIVDMRVLMSKAFEAGTPKAMDTLEEILKVHLVALFIDGFMEAARKTWIPGGHEGSQSTSGSALRQLWNATAKVLDDEKRQWAEDTGEEESEYEE